MENQPAVGYAAIFAIFTVLYLVNAWAPESSSDGSGYHLGIIADYLRSHGFHRIATNMYAGLSEGAELLYALAFAFGRHSATALVHLSFAVALALGMLAYGLRLGKWWVGAGAALLVYLSPVVGRDATTAYVDVAAAAVVFAVFYWVEIWEESGNDRLLIAVGLLAGYAYATKYTAALILVYALIVVAWRKRSLRQPVLKPLLIVCISAAAMMLPWMLKDWIYLHDPIAPLAVSLFRNPNLHILMIQEWQEYLRDYEVIDKWKLPILLTVRGAPVQGIVGPIFLLAPLALFALRYRTGRRLLLAAGIVLAAYPGNIGTRFLIPFLPFVAMAMALAVGSVPRLVAALVFLHAIASWPPIMDKYVLPGAWRIDTFPLRAALRRESEDHYLRDSGDGYLDARMVEKFVPRGERVLARGPDRGFLHHARNPDRVSRGLQSTAQRHLVYRIHRWVSAESRAGVSVQGTNRTPRPYCADDAGGAAHPMERSRGSLFESRRGNSAIDRLESARLAQSLGRATRFRQLAGDALEKLGGSGAGRLRRDRFRKGPGAGSGCGGDLGRWGVVGATAGRNDG